jgi:hypothetical protein
VDILKVPGRIVTGASASAGPAAAAPAAAFAAAPASGVQSAAALDALSPLAAGAANPAGLAEQQQQQEGSALAAPDNSSAPTAGQSAKRPADPSENPHYYVWSDRMSRARVYADVNTKRPREYWDYESLSINWGCVAVTRTASRRTAR